MGKLRVEIRVVVVPLNDGDEVRVMAIAQRIIADIGAFVDSSVKPYAKPPGSYLVRLEANCEGDASRLVDGLVTTAGGTGWATSGGDGEIEAIWAPQDGAAPPLCPATTWAQIQTIPLSALPISRRLPGN